LTDQSAAAIATLATRPLRSASNVEHLICQAGPDYLE